MAEFQVLNGGNSEVQDKQGASYAWAPSGTVGIAATGVIEGLGVTQTGTASGSVLIGTGACVNQASLGQGLDQLVNSGSKTLDVFTSNPMGALPRRDIVVFDSITSVIIAIIGTPNASPSDPTVPATAVALARLRHDASATSIPTSAIDDMLLYTTPRQAAIPPMVFAASVSPASGFAGTIDFWTKGGIVWCRSVVTKSGANIANTNVSNFFAVPSGLGPPGQWSFPAARGDTGLAYRVNIVAGTGIAFVNNLTINSGEPLEWAQSWPLA